MNNNMKFVGSLLLEIGKVHIHVCVYSVLQVPVVSQVTCDIHTYLCVHRYSPTVPGVYTAQFKDV